MAANSFGTLVTSIQVALDTVLREQIGFIPAVWQNMEASQAAYGQTIQYPIVPTMVAEDASPDCCDFPCADGDTWGVGSMTLNYNRRVNFCWSGEDDAAIRNSYNYNADNMRGQTVQQAVRALVNEVEVSIANTAYNAAQVYTPASTTLFSTQADNLKDLTLIRKALIDNNTPDDGDLHLIMNTLSGAQVRNLYNVTRANENASNSTLRTGNLLEMMGFGLHESKFANSNRTGGTGTGYLVNHGGGYAIGATSIVLDTGSGTILPGDVVTIGSYKYTVVSYGSNTLVLNQGLRAAVADDAAVTVTTGSYSGQLAMHRRAIVLATRAPYIQGGRDRATNRDYITDPMSGLTLMVSEYPGYRANSWELSLVWGVKMVKPEMAVYIPQ